MALEMYRALASLCARSTTKGIQILVREILVHSINPFKTIYYLSIQKDENVLCSVSNASIKKIERVWIKILKVIN